MAQTYVQLQAHIAELQAQAEKAKRSEVADVIAKAKDAIRVYGLTVQDLFDAKPARGSKAKKGPKVTEGKTSAVKYADGKGGVWVGRGKRPDWLTERLKAGATLEQFLVDGVTASSAPAPVAEAAPAQAAKKGKTKKASPKKAARTTGQPKYQDGAGNSWSGFGPRPKWVKEAIASGKALEDFRS